MANEQERLQPVGGGEPSVASRPELADPPSGRLSQQRASLSSRHRKSLIVAGWLKPTTILSSILAVLTAIYVYVTLGLLDETREAVELTRQGLEMTRRSVEATEASLKFTEESNSLTRESNDLTRAGLEESRLLAEESNRLTTDSVDISREALRLTRTQAELASRQTHLEEGRLQPAIRIRRFQRADDFGAYYDVAEFWNGGEPLRSFGLRQWSFLQITRLNANYKAEGVRFYPWWFFGPYETTQNDVGLLATFEATYSEYDRAVASSKRRSANDALETFRKKVESMTFDDGTSGLSRRI